MDLSNGKVILEKKILRVEFVGTDDKITTEVDAVLFLPNGSLDVQIILKDTGKVIGKIHYLDLIKSL